MTFRYERTRTEIFLETFRQRNGRINIAFSFSKSVVEIDITAFPDCKGVIESAFGDDGLSLQFFQRFINFSLTYLIAAHRKMQDFARAFQFTERTKQSK